MSPRSTLVLFRLAQARRLFDTPFLLQKSANDAQQMLFLRTIDRATLNARAGTSAHYSPCFISSPTLYASAWHPPSILLGACTRVFVLPAAHRSSSAFWIKPAQAQHRQVHVCTARSIAYLYCFCLICCMMTPPKLRTKVDIVIVELPLSSISFTLNGEKASFASLIENS